VSIFIGSGVALVTPFNDDGNVDYDALARLIDWHIAEGTDAISICGTTGEASTLSDDEHLSVVGFTIKHTAGRIPVIAGVGSNDTRHACYMAAEADKLGADALLHVTPYYNKTTEAGLVAHYRKVASASKLPLLLYSVPSRTGVNISPAVCAALSDVSNIVGIKEASGDIGQVCEIARLRGPSFDIYSGNDDVIVPTLSLGGKGVISVLANVAPKDTHDMVTRYLAGDTNGSRDLQLASKGLVNALFIEVNPIPVKAALSMMGLIGYNLRLPLVPLSDVNYEAVKSEMQKYGLI
jgi:4-hydroxy-tetrahydrodipicolinate synthase